MEASSATTSAGRIFDQIAGQALPGCRRDRPTRGRRTKSSTSRRLKEFGARRAHRTPVRRSHVSYIHTSMSTIPRNPVKPCSRAAVLLCCCTVVRTKPTGPRWLLRYSGMWKTKRKHFCTCLRKSSDIPVVRLPGAVTEHARASKYSTVLQGQRMAIPCFSLGVTRCPVYFEGWMVVLGTSVRTIVRC